MFLVLAVTSVLNLYKFAQLSSGAASHLVLCKTFSTVTLKETRGEHFIHNWQLWKKSVSLNL